MVKTDKISINFTALLRALGRHINDNDLIAKVSFDFLFLHGLNISQIDEIMREFQGMPFEVVKTRDIWIDFDMLSDEVTIQ
jgi:hypothetical protein